MKIYLVREYDYDWSETHGAWSTLESAQAAADKVKPTVSSNFWTIEELELDKPDVAKRVLEYGRSNRWEKPFA